MKAFIVGAIVATSLFGHASVSAQPVDWAMRLRRTGPVRIGMSLRQLRNALGEAQASLASGVPGEPANDECAYLRSTAVPSGVLVMFARGRVVRVDVRGRPTTTASGVGVGATEAEVLRTYPGRIRVEPHKYDPSGHYLRYVAVDPVDSHFGMVFETDGARVTSFRAGTLEAIALVEGCA